MRVAFIAFILLVTSAARAEEITCPQSIEATPQMLSSPMPGWNPFIDQANTRYLLESMALYSGQPSQQGELAPDETNSEFAQWTLYENGIQHYFLACRYSDTSLQLTRELPSTFKACRMTFESDESIDGMPAPQRIACQ